MELRLIMKALKKAEQTHKEQQAFWETFDEIWGEVGAETNNNQTEHCLHNEVDDFVIDKIETALRETNGNRTHAAKKLGIKRETLLAKIKRYSHSLNCHKS